MDNTNRQVKCIAISEILGLEAKLKITCCIYFLARTTVEQAANTGPMFELTKNMIRELDNPHAAYF